MDPLSWRPPAAFRPSLLPQVTSGLGLRLAWAGAVVGLLWTAVAWSLG
jgi:hypothetical protein